MHCRARESSSSPRPGIHGPRCSVSVHTTAVLIRSVREPSASLARARASWRRCRRSGRSTSGAARARSTNSTMLTALVIAARPCPAHTAGLQQVVRHEPARLEVMLGTQAGQPDTSATAKSCATPPTAWTDWRRKAFAKKSSGFHFGSGADSGIRSAQQDHGDSSGYG